jgi:hypothetical protein
VKSQHPAIAAALMALGAGVGICIYAALEPSYRSELRPYKSGFEEKMDVVSGATSISVNYISRPSASRSRSRFTYWTGAMALGEHAVSPPVTVVEFAQRGRVRVEVKSDARAPEQAGIADAVARRIDTATGMFWPEEKIPVEVELHEVPPDSRFEFARKIAWRIGRPFHLTLFITETQDAQDQAGIAVHELYHVLTTRWRLGSKSERGIQSPWLGSLFEEITASLVADCSRLRLTGRLALPELRGDFVMDWGNGKTTYTSSLDARGLNYLLDHANAAKFKFTPGLLNDLMRSTAQASLQPEDNVFLEGSDSAEKLLALCHEAIADPWYLEGWFQQMIARDPAP